MWMDLETVIQSEISQKQKNKYHVLMHIYAIYKNGTDEPICKAGIVTDIDYKHVDTEREKVGSDLGAWDWQNCIFNRSPVKYLDIFH